MKKGDFVRKVESNICGIVKGFPSTSHTYIDILCEGEDYRVDINNLRQVGEFNVFDILRHTESVKMGKE